MWKKHASEVDRPNPPHKLLIYMPESDDEECLSDQSSDVSERSSDDENHIKLPIESKVTKHLNDIISCSSANFAGDRASVNAEHMTYIPINSNKSLNKNKMLNEDSAMQML